MGKTGWRSFTIGRSEFETIEQMEDIDPIDHDNGEQPLIPAIFFYDRQ